MRKQRWDDPHYLARIIFCEMVRDDIGGDLNFGISSRLVDNNRPIIVIDTQTGTIGFVCPGMELAPIVQSKHIYVFEHFAKLADEEIKKLWEEATQEFDHSL